MVIQIDTKLLSKRGISPDQYVLLNLLFYKEISTIKEIFSKTEFLQLRDTIPEKYLVSLRSAIFSETEINKKAVGELLNIDTGIRFIEFYSEYPIKVGGRALRATRDSAMLWKKHERKYLKIVKSTKQHKLAIESIRAFVYKKKRLNELEFLPQMETVLNNALWEQWESFIDDEGTVDWTVDSI